MGLLSGIASLFVDTSNPYEFAKGESDYYKKLASEYLDPNSAYYSSQTGKYFRQLTKSMNSASPTTDSLLALASAGGRSQGAATSVANAQRKAIEARNRDTASSSAENFNTNIVGQGLNFANANLGRSADMMGLYGQGEQYSQEVGNNFASSLLDLGAGFLGDYMGSETQVEDEEEPSGGGYSAPVGSSSQFKLGQTNNSYDYTKLGGGGGGKKAYNPYKLGGF